MNKIFRIKTKIFYNAKMYNLVNEYIKTQNKSGLIFPQHNEYDRLLVKILNLFQSEKLKNRLSLEELEAYIKYIKPLVNKEKNFHIVTGIFFASLIAMVAPALKIDEYTDDLIQGKISDEILRGKLTDDIVPEDWITKIDELQKTIIDIYLDKIEYENYRDTREKAQNNPKMIGAKLQEKYPFITKQSFIDKHKQIYKNFAPVFSDLNSICYNIAILNYENNEKFSYQFSYSEKLEKSFKMIKSLSDDRKEKLIDGIADKIDFIYYSLRINSDDSDK